MVSFNNVSKCNVWPNISDLNRDAFANVGVRHDHDEVTLKFGNTVGL